LLLFLHACFASPPACFACKQGGDEATPLRSKERSEASMQRIASQDKTKARQAEMRAFVLLLRFALLRKRWATLHLRLACLAKQFVAFVFLLFI
jgi:hypothetical protein